MTEFKRTSNGSKWRQVVRFVVSRDGGVCGICGHGGARHVDHIQPVVDNPLLEWDTSNMTPAHGWSRVNDNPCVVCTEAARKLNPGAKPVRCNNIKMGYSLERARSIIESRTGLKLGNVAPEDPGDADWW